MIQGVNVLETIIETQSTACVSDLLWGVIAIMIGIVFIFTLILMMVDIFKKRRKIKMDCLIIWIIIFLSLGTGMYSAESYFTSEEYTTTKYKVTIDDSVNFNEFMNRYEVINHDGVVYVIQDKLDIRE